MFGGACCLYDNPPAKCGFLLLLLKSTVSAIAAFTVSNGTTRGGQRGEGPELLSLKLNYNKTT